MNKSIERKIRQAELEYTLLTAWKKSCDNTYYAPFKEFLEYQVENNAWFNDESEELLNIYAGE